MKKPVQRKDISAHDFTIAPIPWEKCCFNIPKATLKKLESFSRRTGRSQSHVIRVALWHLLGKSPGEIEEIFQKF